MGNLKILSLLLQYSTLTKVLPVTCVYVQKYSKTIRKHTEAVVENGNKNSVKNLFIAQVFRIELMPEAF